MVIYKKKSFLGGYMKNITLSNRTKGVLFIIISAFGFAMMSAFVKLSGDLPSFQKTFLEI